MATKEDVLLVEERLKGEIRATKEEILRGVDNKFNQIKILIIIVLFAIQITNQT